jgi:hypothetical protein
MRKPPAVATRLLLGLGAPDDSVVGDLLEEYQSGRSRLWYWRQVLSAVWLSSLRNTVTHPTRTLVSVATGWTTLLLVFFTLGDRSADALAGWLWHWNRQTAYATGIWWPFQICAVLVSYSGFALSAVVVARLNRRHSPSVLVAYVGSVVLVLSASAAFLEILIRRNGAVPVPHGLFYIVSVTLPYHWRSGLLLAPAIVLCVGLVTSDSYRRTRRERAS